MGSAVLLLKNTFFCVLNRFTPTAYPFVRYAFKAEFNNPSSSIQDRVAFSALEEGFRSQILRKDDTIVCKGLSKKNLSFLQLSSLFGLRTLQILPENCPSSYKSWIEYCGGEIKFIPSSATEVDYIDRANRLCKENASFHSADTLPADQNLFEEMIDEDKDNRNHPHLIVAPINRDDAIPGRKAFCEKHPDTKVVGVLIEGQESYLQDTSFLESVVKVDRDSALKRAKQFLSEEGISVGIISGAVLAATVTLIGEQDFGPSDTEMIFTDKAFDSKFRL